MWWLREIFEDETGSPSAARILLVLWLAFAAYQLAHGRESVTLHDGMIALIGWAAGPRLAKYLFPQLGGMAKAVAESTKAKIAELRKEDERGAYTRREPVEDT